MDFGDTGRQAEAQDGGGEACGTWGAVVSGCPPTDDDATDWDRLHLSQRVGASLTSAPFAGMAHCYTSVARMTVSAHYLSDRSPALKAATPGLH